MSPLKRILIGGLLLGLPFLVQAADWQRVHSPGGYYSILMPGTPQFSHSSTESPVGRIPEEICEYTSERLDLTAEVSFLPGIAVFFGGHTAILEKASAAYLEHVKGSLTTSQAVKSNGYRGKEIHYTAPGKNGRRIRGIARFFLVQKRLYVLVGDRDLETGNDAAVKKFLNSFMIEGFPSKKSRTLHPIPLSRPD